MLDLHCNGGVARGQKTRDAEGLSEGEAEHGTLWTTSLFLEDSVIKGQRTGDHSDSEGWGESPRCSLGRRPERERL